MQDKAFELIFSEHNRMITAYLHSLTGDWEAAVDLTQETFIVAYRKMDSFDTGKSLAAWLRGIAKNLARNHLRKISHRRKFIFEDENLENIYSTFDDADSETPWEEWLAALDSCIEKLPERRSQVIELHYHQGNVAKVIAGQLGIVEKSVFQVLWVARKSLRHCIESMMRQKEVSHG